MPPESTGLKGSNGSTTGPKISGVVSRLDVVMADIGDIADGINSVSDEDWQFFFGCEPVKNGSRITPKMSGLEGER